MSTASTSNGVCKRCGTPSQSYRCIDCNEAHRKDRNQAKSFCGYCGQKGHNKRACSALAADKARIRDLDAGLLASKSHLTPDKHPTLTTDLSEEVIRLRKEVKRLSLQIEGMRSATKAQEEVDR